ncbi:MAG: aminoacyl-tRNA hydrolase [Rickettsiales bacterium]
MTYLIIGLGNPDKKHQGNRHNIGFMASDYIRDKRSFSKPQLKFGGELSEGFIGGNKVFILKPLSYMNLSGNPAVKATNFYKIDLGKIIVIHDDLDLLTGKIKVKIGGGNGGHNGLKSLDSHLGADYTRIRIGIGRPEIKDMVSHYVLSDFGKDEREIMENTVEAINDNLELILDGKQADFMNKASLQTKKI